MEKNLKPSEKRNNRKLDSNGRAQVAGRASGKTVRCPRCSSRQVWKNGKVRGGKHQYLCRVCGRAFVLEPYRPKVVEELADRMLAEGLPVAVCTRILNGHVSRRWLYYRKAELDRGNCG